MSKAISTIAKAESARFQRLSATIGRFSNYANRTASPVRLEKDRQSSRGQTGSRSSEAFPTARAGQDASLVCIFRSSFDPDRVVFGSAIRSRDDEEDL